MLAVVMLYVVTVSDLSSIFFSGVVPSTPLSLSLLPRFRIYAKLDNFPETVIS